MVLAQRGCKAPHDGRELYVRLFKDSRVAPGKLVTLMGRSHNRKMEAITFTLASWIQLQQMVGQCINEDFGNSNRKRDEFRGKRRGGRV